MTINKPEQSEEDHPGRGCGTFQIRMSISRLPPEEREAMANLLGEDLALCMPVVAATPSENEKNQAKPE